MNSSPIPAHGQGFTLIELMITLAVAAILLMIAVPSFSAVLERNRLSSYSNELIGSLLYARNEARHRHTEIELCSTRDGETCSSNWASQNAIVVRQTDGTLLRLLPPPPKGSSISVRALEYLWDGSRLEVAQNGAEGAPIRYRSNGQLSADSQGFHARRLCLRLGNSHSALALLQSGQVQVQPEVSCGNG